MRASDIVIGKWYQLKDTTVGYIRPLEVLNINKLDKTRNYLVVKCEHVYQKSDTVGLIKYFRPRDMVEIE